MPGGGLRICRGNRISERNFSSYLSYAQHLIARHPDGDPGGGRKADRCCLGRYRFSRLVQVASVRLGVGVGSSRKCGPAPCAAPGSKRHILQARPLVTSGGTATLTDSSSERL